MFTRIQNFSNLAIAYIFPYSICLLYFWYTLFFIGVTFRYIYRVKFFEILCRTSSKFLKIENSSLKSLELFRMLWLFKNLPRISSDLLLLSQKLLLTCHLIVQIYWFNYLFGFQQKSYFSRCYSNYK